MAYTASTVTTEIRTLSKDSSLTDAMILAWLQTVQDEALGHVMLPQLETLEADTLSTNDLTYTYPTGHQTTVGLSLGYSTDWQDVEYLDFREFNRRHPNPEDQTAGMPIHYTDFGRTVYWDGKLDKDYEIKLRYIRKPVTLAAATEPDIPEEYKQILVRGVLAHIEEYRENFDIAAVHNRRMEDLIEAMVHRYSARQTVTPHRYTRAYPHSKPSGDAGWRTS